MESIIHSFANKSALLFPDLFGAQIEAVLPLMYRISEHTQTHISTLLID